MSCVGSNAMGTRLLSRRALALGWLTGELSRQSQRADLAARLVKQLEPVGAPQRPDHLDERSHGGGRAIF